MTSQEKKESREKIKTAAKILFAEKGYSASGIREISKKASVNVSMISYYFGSKLGLLKELVDEFFNKLQSLYLEISETEDDFDSAIRTLIPKIIAHMGENQEVLRIFMRELSYKESEVIDYQASKALILKDIFYKAVFSKIDEHKRKNLRYEIILPILISSMFSNFIMGNLIKKVMPDVEYNESFYDDYKDYVPEIFLNGIHGLLEKIEKKK